MRRAVKEADLYPPLKAYLEGQGYEVKGEIGACDLMARRGEEPPVIVEMKTSVTLALILQGADRQRMFESVYLAVPAPALRRPREVTHLCRRLGLGLLTVEGAQVTARLDPGPYQPRRRAAAAARLLQEFERRVGDPEAGGSPAAPRMTAYRQAAMALARYLAEHGPTKAADLARATGVAKAGQMLRDDHYGWFERTARGIYALTPRGRA
ncbi:MAG: DUF2161 family putative PD-(D/E)XK-type phosphodiesterase, partial [Pseudomonadota bacterium]